MKIQVIIPVYNPDDKFAYLLEMLEKQSVKNMRVLIIDSGQNHLYQNRIAYDERFFLEEIDSKDFNHGGTRQLGINMFPDEDVYVFLTQDAILADEHAIECLVKCFKDESVGCAYGRQIPHEDANCFSRMARETNYGNASYVRAYLDKKIYGIKTCFISNSFAAYRGKAMEQVEGFPMNTILSEDMYVAAKMLINGWKIAYSAEACVYHSHNYTIWQEFKRYFDIGVFHAREAWIGEAFGRAERQGLKFVVMETKRIIKHNPLLLFAMMLRDGMKYIGYRLGINEKYIPITIKKRISMNVHYWKRG